jgi:hypothetical protein
MPVECEEILERLKSLANPEAVAGMARYGTSRKDGASAPSGRSGESDRACARGASASGGKALSLRLELMLV